MANHWANEDTVLGHIHSVLVPYIVDTCSELKLPQSSPALSIFDHFSGQLAERVKNVLESNNILLIDMPSNCTDRLQPMDIIINKSIKASLKASLSSWYADQVQKQQGDHQLIDMRLSVLKPFGARWFIKAFQHVADNPDMVSVLQE